MGVLDYVALTSDSPAALANASSGFWLAAHALGWRCLVRGPSICVYVAGAARLRITASSDGRSVLLGDCFRAGGGSAAQEHERRRLLEGGVASVVARGLLLEVWGRYVVLRQDHGRASAMRDPSGAIDCLGWRRFGCTIWSSGLAAPVDDFMPADTAIDQGVLKRSIAAPGEFRHALALTHIVPCPAGALVAISEDGSSSVDALWTPARAYRSRPSRVASPDHVRRIVQDSTRAIASIVARPIAELSGGLDSAIVAAALDAPGRAAVHAWINHYTDTPGGDERRYAQAVARRFGLDLTVSRRGGYALSEVDFVPETAIARPATNDVDIAYSRDMTARAADGRADGIVTGQGGDAVFFQMPTPLVAIDEMLERSFLMRPRVLMQTARWTRRSAWPHAWRDAWRGRWKGSPDEHPWLQDLDRVPPAKALQIRAVAACQTFHQPSLRNRSVELLHPLLSQPILELGLSIPTPELTSGGRDRALARAAFANDLPSVITTRLSKGDMSSFFGREVVRNLPFLRSFLLEGRLAGCGLLDTATLEARLTDEALLQLGGSRRILSLALVEGWYRDWEARLTRLRSLGTSRPGFVVDR